MPGLVSPGSLPSSLSSPFTVALGALGFVSQTRHFCFHTGSSRFSLTSVSHWGLSKEGEALRETEAQEGDFSCVLF